MCSNTLFLLPCQSANIVDWYCISRRRSFHAIYQRVRNIYLSSKGENRVGKPPFVQRGQLNLPYPRPRIRLTKLHLLNGGCSRLILTLWCAGQAANSHVWSLALLQTRLRAHEKCPVGAACLHASLKRRAHKAGKALNARHAVAARCRDLPGYTCGGSGTPGRAATAGSARRQGPMYPGTGACLPEGQTPG